MEADKRKRPCLGKDKSDSQKDFMKKMKEHYMSMIPQECGYVKEV